MNSATRILDRVGRDSAASLSPLQDQVDGLVGGFAQQVTAWRSLAAVTVGGMAYRAGRIGAMGLGNSSALRAASVGLGLTAEVSAFEFTHRGLDALNPTHSGNSNLWRWNGNGGLRQGLLQSFVTFGALKGAGRLVQGENLISQHLLQDSAMVLGHQVTGAFGLTPRPTGSLAEQFLHAEATNLQMAAGMALAHGFAPGLRPLERGLDLFSERGSSPASLYFFDRWNRNGGALATAGARPFLKAEAVPSAPIFAMSVPKEREESPGLPGEAAWASGEMARVDHPAIDLFLQLIEKVGSNPEAAAAMIPRGEWEALTRLSASTVVPRGRAARNAILHQALSGATGLQESFDALKAALDDINYFGRIYAAASSNKFAAAISNLEYLREERPKISFREVLNMPAEKLGEDLADAREDLKTALSALAELYQTLTDTDQGAFLRAAFIGGSGFGSRGIRYHYRRFENSILKVLPPEYLAEVGLQSVPSYDDLVRKTWKLTRLNPVK